MCERVWFLSRRERENTRIQCLPQTALWARLPEHKQGVTAVTSEDGRDGRDGKQGDPAESGKEDREVLGAWSLTGWIVTG